MSLYPAPVNWSTYTVHGPLLLPRWPRPRDQRLNRLGYPLANRCATSPTLKNSLSYLAGEWDGVIEGQATLDRYLIHQKDMSFITDWSERLAR